MPEGEEEEQKKENLFENIMKENFPNLTKDIDFQEIQEAQRVPEEVGPKEAHSKAHHNYISQDYTEGENLRSSKRKGHSYLQRSSHRLSADLSKETLQARRGWKEVFKVMKSKDPHPKLLYPAKLPFRMEGQIKCFPD